MDNLEARSLLPLVRPGEAETDVRFREAEARAESDPELAHWWRAEREADDAIARKLQATHVPAGVSARILAGENSPNEPSQTRWRRRILLVAAAIVALAVMFGSWRGPFQPAASLADYRDQMASFANVAPSLTIESNDFSEIAGYLRKTGMPGAAAVPAKLRQMEPMGCRTLRFRQHEVALICFKRGQGKLLHLFVVNRKAVARGSVSGQPMFAEADGWMTATWQNGDEVWLMMLRGDRAELEKYLADSQAITR